MRRLQGIAREPLVHFVVLGAALFVLFDVFGDVSSGRSNQVVVSSTRIEDLAELFRQTWRRPPSAAELDGLIEDFVTEEILYREALVLGLDRDDSVIRRRLRQKMEFIAESAVADTQPTDEELRAFLREHRDRFREPWRISFTQVYLSPDRRGQKVWAEAESLLVALTAGDSKPADSGDPFMLEQHFRDVPAPEVERLFGSAFAMRVADLPLGRWAGPIQSGYGLHLVLVGERRPERLPELDEVRDAVVRDWRAQQRQEVSSAFHEKLRANYEITIERPPQPRDDAASSTEDR